MKPLLLVIALALPIPAAATVAMEPQQATALQDAAQPRPSTSPSPAKGSKHHPIFIVKFVLQRSPPPAKVPQIIMDEAGPQLVPPTEGGYPTAALGAMHRDPNTTICHGRSCEGHW